MLRYRSQVVVDRPRDVAFPYIVEPAKQALWSDVPMRLLTEGPLATGSRMELSFGKGPMTVRLGLELTAVEDGRRMAWTTFSGPIRWDGEYRLEDAPEGRTTVSQEGSFEFRGLWRLLEPLLGAEMRKGEEKELQRLKAVIEAA